MAIVGDLYNLMLVDGLETTVDGKSVRYKAVKLRETTVADEAKAAQLSERAVKLPTGVWQLLPSEELYNQVMSMQTCERFTCEGFDDIDQTVMDITLFGKLSKYDLQAIEERILLVESAAQLRHGLITEQQFQELQQGLIGEEKSAPSTQGQAEELGNPDSHPVAKVERLTPGAGTASQGSSVDVGKQA